MNEFWKTKKLEEMDSQEWESICHKCGDCCYIWSKGLNEERIIHHPCELLNTCTKLCKDYSNRQKIVPECVQLTPSNVSRSWLPEHCSYVRLKEGKDLAEDHPLKNINNIKEGN